MIGRLLGGAPKVSRVPWLDVETLSKLSDVLSTAKIYFEYGSGGSTYFALENSSAVVYSVESDRKFLKVLEKDLAELYESRFFPLAVDIGLTGCWGRPLFTFGKDFSIYPKCPFDLYPGVIPDVVFVDGRFRKACILEVMYRVPSNWDGVIVVDDYADRDYLKSIEQFSAETLVHGRGVSIKVDPQRSYEKIKNMLESSYHDHR